MTPKTIINNAKNWNFIYNKFQIVTKWSKLWPRSQDHEDCEGKGKHLLATTTISETKRSLRLKRWWWATIDCINEKTTMMIKSMRSWDITKAMTTNNQLQHREDQHDGHITRCKIKRVMQVALSYNNVKTKTTMTKIIRRGEWHRTWAMASHCNTKNTTTINMGYNNKKSTNMSINMTRKSQNQWRWHSK